MAALLSVKLNAGFKHWPEKCLIAISTHGNSYIDA